MGENLLKIAIMQPTFNPWIGHFDLIDYVDKFIFFDTTQFIRREWQNRNSFKINNQKYMFTIPVLKTKTRDQLLIKDAQIDFSQFNFKDKLKKLLELNYKKAPYFEEVHNFILKNLYFDTIYLSKYNINLITNISKKIGIETEIVVLSETDFKSDRKKGELILDICKYFNATDYISPAGAKGYLEYTKELFDQNSITIKYQNYHHPTYNQIGSEFISHIGIIDLLYNEGFKTAKDIILKGREYISQ